MAAADFLKSLAGSRPPAQDRWEYSPTIPFGQGSLVTAFPAEDIDDIEWQDSRNLVVRKGSAQVDSGYAPFAIDPWTTLAQVLEGRPRRAMEHVDLSGSRIQLLVTNTILYFLDTGPTDSYWAPVSSGTSTTLNGNASGTTAILTSVAGFSINDYIGLTDNNGDVFLAQIDNIVVNTLTLDRSLPATFNSGNVVYRCLNGGLNGSDDHQVDWVFHPIKRWVIFTNNVDVVFKYIGSTAAALGGLSGISLTKARCVSIYNGLLHLGNVTVSGTARPGTVYWSDIDPEVYTVGAGSLAGFSNLSDVVDRIIGMETLLTYNIIYLDRSMVRQTLIGSTNKLFDFKTIVGGTLGNALGTGLVGTNAIYAFPDVHIFLSHDGIRIYRGDYRSELISDPIFDGFFDVNGDVNRSTIGRSFLFYVEGRNELYVCYADGSSTFPKSAIIIDLSTEKFYFRQFTHELTFADRRIGTDDLTIEELVGTIAEQNWSLDSGAAAVGFVVHILGRADVNKTYVFDLVTPDEDGTSIVWSLISKEYRTEGVKRRFDKHLILLSGASAVLERSIDRGQSYTPLAFTPPGASSTLIEIYPEQFVTDTVTYKISGIGGGAELYRLAVYSKDESQNAF